MIKINARKSWKSFEGHIRHQQVADYLIVLLLHFTAKIKFQLILGAGHEITLLACQLSQHLDSLA